MRSIFFIAFFLLVTNLLAQKQLDPKDIVVKDSAGQVYPQEIWMALYQKGSYDLRPESSQKGNKTFLLVRLSDEETRKKMEKMPKPRPSKFFSNGQKLQFFKAKDIEDNEIDFEALKGKIIVMNFWFINCRPCRMEIPDLNKLVDSFRSNENVVFLGVALDSRPSIEKFTATTPFNYKLIASGSYISAQYGVTSYPTHAIIDQEGTVYFHTSGLAANTVYWVEKSIRELLAKDTAAK